MQTFRSRPTTAEPEALAFKRWKIIPRDETPGYREPVMVRVGETSLWQPIGDPDAEQHARLIAYAPDLLLIASLPVIYEVAGEGVIRLSIGGYEVCKHPAKSTEGMALLRFDAKQRAAIALATEVA